MGAYGMSTWGIERAVEFISSFKQVFALLGRHPDMGRERDDLGVGVRSWLYRGYVIYYVHLNGNVVIGRILHGASDPGPHFDAKEVGG